MKSNHLVSIILVTIFSSVFGQTDQPKVLKKISVSDLYIQTGYYFQMGANMSPSDYRKFVPQSSLLDYKPMDNASLVNNSGLTNDVVHSVLLGIKFSDGQKYYKGNPLLRIGVSYFSGSPLATEFNKEDRKTYSQTGQTYYVDSISIKNYNIYYSFEQLRLDASLIFRTNPESRWSLFTGIGITAGGSVKAKTNIDYNSYDYTEFHYSNGNVSAPNSPRITSKTENHKNKNNVAASAFVPIGVDFRLGNKKEFWKKIHLFYEMRPGFNISSIPELGVFTNASLQHGLLGVRVSW